MLFVITDALLVKRVGLGAVFKIVGRLVAGGPGPYGPFFYRGP